MIKLTIIRTDKSNTKTVVLKTMERLIERIANGNVVFRSFNGLLLLTFGGIRSEEQADSAKCAVPMCVTGERMATNADMKYITA